MQVYTDFQINAIIGFIAHPEKVHWGTNANADRFTTVLNINSKIVVITLERQQDRKVAVISRLSDLLLEAPVAQSERNKSYSNKVVDLYNEKLKQFKQGQIPRLSIEYLVERGKKYLYILPLAPESTEPNDNQTDEDLQQSIMNSFAAHGWTRIISKDSFEINGHVVNISKYRTEYFHNDVTVSFPNSKINTPEGKDMLTNIINKGVKSTKQAYSFTCTQKDVNLTKEKADAISRLIEAGWSIEYGPTGPDFITLLSKNGYTAQITKEEIVYRCANTNILFYTPYTHEIGKSFPGSLPVKIPAKTKKQLIVHQLIYAGLTSSRSRPNTFEKQNLTITICDDYFHAHIHDLNTVDIVEINPKDSLWASCTALGLRIQQIICRAAAAQYRNQTNCQ